MSAVINKAKQHYLKALKVEIGLLVFVAVSLLFLGFNVSFSFFLGSLAIFIPHCLFVYWIFFKKSAKNRSKMTAFYRGEGVKWLSTIVLVVACFKWVSFLHLIAFFAGYFVALFANNVIPFVLSAKSERSQQAH